jgi:hypothetical protein
MAAAHQRRLNLANLNPVPANLHLAVAPPDILQIPVQTPPHQVSRPVQPAAAAAIPIRHKTRRRLPATSQITTRQTNPAQIQLANNPFRNQP